MAGNTEEQDNNTTEVSRKAYIVWNAVFVASLGFIGITGFNLAIDNARHTEQLKNFQAFMDEGPRSTKQDREMQVATLYRHIDAKLRPHEDHLVRAETGYKRIRDNERSIEGLSARVEKMTSAIESLKDKMQTQQAVIDRHGGIEAHAVANSRMNAHDRMLSAINQELREVKEELKQYLRFGYQFNGGLSSE